MCGIFFSASPRARIEPSDETVRVLKSRGPESYKQHNVNTTLDRCDDLALPKAEHVVHLTFASSVLALRGDHVQVQPMLDESIGSVFCWNGEAWNLGGRMLTGNDTVYVFQSLLDAAKPVHASTDRITNVLTNISGPYSFVFYDAQSQTVYYGRDRLGRRSLMVSEDPEGGFILASTSIGLPKPCREVNTNSIFQVKLDNLHGPPKTLQWTMALPDINKSLMAGSHQYSNPSTSSVHALIAQLRDSVCLRVTDIPTLSSSKSDIYAAKVAILFSGGLDCTLLARLVNDLLPVDEIIDLLNIAFENPRSVASAGTHGTASPYESCPDRVTGRSSFAELVQVCPQRQWHFVAIDIPFTETCAHRPGIIELMKPHNTEMDLSIAMALYFAARGEGSVLADAQAMPKTYKTPARVLISGLGADELFAGYTRHATVFSRGGFAALVDELELDFARIGTRNLGRDDRVISHWGKEVRYPYLDETFVSWALGLPVWEKCGFRTTKENTQNGGSDEKDLAKREAYQKVKGDGSLTNNRVYAPQVLEKQLGRRGSPVDLDPAKMLLRLAAWELGMKGVAGEKKRAIQFGARTAKMEISKEGGKRKGTDVLE